MLLADANMHILFWKALHRLTEATLEGWQQALLGGVGIKVLVHLVRHLAQFLQLFFRYFVVWFVEMLSSDEQREVVVSLCLQN